MINGSRRAFRLVEACLVLKIMVSVFAEGKTDSPSFAQPDYTVYHTLSQAFQLVDEIVQRNPSSFKTDEMTAGGPEYSSTLKVVTIEPSGHSVDHSQKIRLLLLGKQDFGEHGRELVTVEVALQLMHLLSDPQRMQQLVAARGGNHQKLLLLLEHCVFKIIPVENTRGRELVENGTLCERKNGRGVDGNRNWSVHWGFREKDYDPSEEYPGKEPFSEPEVQMLNRVALEFQPHVWINMHSGMEALFMPYDHVAALPDDSAGRVSLSLLLALDSVKCGGRCATGSGGKSVGYLAHGTATDYMHDVLGVPFSFTWEIYGDNTASFQDCFRMFNPLSKDHLEQVVMNWADAVLAMVELLPSSRHARGGTSSMDLHRKFMPQLQDQHQKFNHTQTDVAAETRVTRLSEVLAAVTNVEQALGVPVLEQWELLIGTPGLACLLLLCVGLLVLGVVTGKELFCEFATRSKSRSWRRKHAAVL